MWSFSCGTFVPVRCHKFSFPVEIPWSRPGLQTGHAAARNFQLLVSNSCATSVGEKYSLFYQGGPIHAKPCYQPMPSMGSLDRFRSSGGNYTFTLVEFYNKFYTNKSKSRLKNTTRGSVFIQGRMDFSLLESMLGVVGASSRKAARRAFEALRGDNLELPGRFSHLPL